METFRKINLNAAETMANFKIIPVAVLNSVDQGLRIAELLTKYGISAIEITFRTQVAAQAIAAVNAAFPGMFTGAGTILNCDDLRRAMDAGARFAVAPGFNPQIVAMARINCIPFVPGIATPSELEQAYAAGCSFLKFFPAEAAGGVKMLKAMTAPYRHLGIKFMPTGGVTQENVAEYLAIPKVAAVGGTWLTKDPGNCENSIKTAAELVKKLKS